jgi:CRISPR-associated protein Cmr5
MQEQQLSRRQNSEQKRGKQAWENVCSLKKKNPSAEDVKREKEYRSLARGLNAMIQINGLGPTLGFLKAKGKNSENTPHYLLLSHLTVWMRDGDHFRAQNSDAMNTNYDGLLNWLLDTGTSSDDYRRATTECLAFGAWLRRFAEAELKEPDPGEEQR